MKINIEVTGDLEKAIKRVSKNGELSYTETIHMLCENGLIRFTKTLAKELKKDKRQNRWYRKLLRKLFRRNK